MRTTSRSLPLLEGEARRGSSHRTAQTSPTGQPAGGIAFPAPLFCADTSARTKTILAYTLRRTLILVASLFVAAVVLFVLLRLLPGDPANALLGVGATEQQIAAARAQVGSDQPLYAQFVGFIGNLARFDLGTSFVSRASVLEEIGNRLSVTLPLTILGFAAAFLIAVPLGVIAAVRSTRWYGAAISVSSQLGIAIPVFWVGIL